MLSLFTIDPATISSQFSNCFLHNPHNLALVQKNNPQDSFVQGAIYTNQVRDSIELSGVAHNKWGRSSSVDKALDHILQGSNAF